MREQATIPAFGTGIAFCIFVSVGLHFSTFKYDQVEIAIGDVNWTLSHFVTAGCINVGTFGAKNMFSALMNGGKCYVTIKSRVEVEDMRYLFLICIFYSVLQNVIL